MNNISFGQYYPADSAVHRLDPRVKLICTVIYVAAVFFIDSYFAYAAVLLFGVAVIAAARVPLGTVLRTVRSVLFLILLTFALNLFLVSGDKILWSWKFLKITETGLDYAVRMALRLFLLITGTGLLTLTTTPIELTDGLESLMSPLKAIRFPVRDIALIMSIALRFIPTLMEETNKIMNAQKARGASFDTGNLLKRVKALLPVLIPLFVSAFRRAEELADAMDSRCYNAAPKRTRRRQFKIQISDIIALLVFAAFITLVILDKYLWGGAMDAIIYNLIFVK
ncbi:MAG: energy-coupling factor transporter transmembrane protein EcfT [Clostridiales bacterium]|jgi:energy-coupling factor transport system permease protein|nr:energy-coupling factor transporter transmembrane protein EcfT [Clostridiales bacterium]